MHGGRDWDSLPVPEFDRLPRYQPSEEKKQTSRSMASKQYPVVLDHETSSDFQDKADGLFCDYTVYEYLAGQIVRKC